MRMHLRATDVKAESPGPRKAVWDPTFDSYSRCPGNRPRPSAAPQRMRCVVRGSRRLFSQKLFMMRRGETKQNKQKKDNQLKQQQVGKHKQTPIYPGSLLKVLGMRRAEAGFARRGKETRMQRNQPQTPECCSPKRLISYSRGRNKFSLLNQ